MTMTKEAEIESNIVVDLIELMREMLKPESNADLLDNYITFNVKILRFCLNDEISLGKEVIKSINHCYWIYFYVIM